jgi:trans-aconitate methyltransferase
MHWDAVYGRLEPDQVSWYQAEPTVSMQLIEELGVVPGAAVLDVGGGVSALASTLISEGFHDVTVLDVSQTALDRADARMPRHADVEWIRGDLLTWTPARRYGLWHDRAVFHFMVEPEDRHRYVEVMRSAVAGGGSVIIATFATDGPDHCSGLPVARYSADELVAMLGPGFDVRTVRREAHTTPRGAIQPFTWVAGRIP